MSMNINGTIVHTVEQFEDAIVTLDDMSKEGLRLDFYQDTVTPEKYPLTYAENVKAKVNTVVSNAVIFGQALLQEFITENVMMGITQANMSELVRVRTQEVRDCLNTASLYSAIAVIKRFPVEDKDPVFITDARLLKMLNAIESYLKLPITLSL